MVFLFAYLPVRPPGLEKNFPGCMGIIQTGFEPIKFLNARSVPLPRKEIVSGGGMTKKFFFEGHYFLRLQRQFPEKWGMSSRFLRHCVRVCIYRVGRR